MVIVVKVKLKTEEWGVSGRWTIINFGDQRPNWRFQVLLILGAAGHRLSISPMAGGA